MGTEQTPGTLAGRLDHLFATVHPKGRGSYSNREVAEAINAKAGHQVMSGQYLWQLRNGVRKDPTHSRLTALAEFFGVSPLYFYDTEVATEADEQLELLAALRDEGVRHIALRADGLSTKALEAILRMVENARDLEGLPGEPTPPRPAD